MQPGAAVKGVHLAIDAADDFPGLALAVDGAAVHTLTWETQRNHSVELLPNIDRLLTETGRTKTDIDGVLIDIGPGGYAALRVGVSVAKALAHALAVPIAGIGRLELDAWTAARSGGGSSCRVVALHRAGRGDLAIAAYARDGDSWVEDAAPQIIPAAALAAQLRPGDAVTGDIDEAARSFVEQSGAAATSAERHRVFALAELGARRLAAGRADDATTLVPLYLRPPAIGPQG